jgi:hypothetical protein
MSRMLTTARRCLIVFGAMLALLGATLTTPQAHAVAASDGAAWHLKVDFPNNQLRVVYTLYEVTGNPLKVINIVQHDITATCITQGALGFDANGYALFNGSTAIRCSLPPEPAGMNSCNCPIPFWTAADVRLTTNNGQNPLIEGTAGGARKLGVSVPRNGGTVRTGLYLQGQGYLSTPWSPSTYNQFLLSSKGPGLVEIAAALGAEGVSVLDYVPGWESHVAAITTANTLDMLAQPAGATWSTAFPGSPWIHPEYVYIGYSPTSGNYFTGGIKHLEIDPPGCRGGI